MKNNLYFHLVVSVLLSLAIALLGGTVAIAQLFVGIQPFMEQFLYPYSNIVPYAGICLLLIGISNILWTLPWFQKGHYECIKGVLKLSIEESTIEESIQTLLISTNKEYEPKCTVTFLKNELHILLRLHVSTQSHAHKKLITENIKSQVKQCLEKKFGYTSNFSLSLLFDQD